MIEEENGNWASPFLDTVVDANDTTYAHFSSTGNYVMYYMKEQYPGTGAPHSKEIIVN